MIRPIRRRGECELAHRCAERADLGVGPPPKLSRWLEPCRAVTLNEAMDDTAKAAGGEAGADAGARQVIALVRDLMFVSRIGGAAKAAGVAIKLVRDPSALSAAEPGHRLIADLNLAGAIEAASRWKQAAPG